MCSILTLRFKQALQLAKLATGCQPHKTLKSANHSIFERRYNASQMTPLCDACYTHNKERYVSCSVGPNFCRQKRGKCDFLEEQISNFRM